ETIVVVERIEEGEMQNGRHGRALVETHRRTCYLVLVGLRPAGRTWHELHAVGPQRIKLAHLRPTPAFKADGLDIGIAGEQKMRGNAFQKRRAVLTRIWPPQEIKQRMRVALRGPFIENEA